MDNSSTSSGSSSVNFIEGNVDKKIKLKKLIVSVEKFPIMSYNNFNYDSDNVRRAGKRIPKRRRSFDYEDDILGFHSRKVKELQSSSGHEKFSKSFSGESVRKKSNKRNVKRSRDRSRLNSIRRSLNDDNTTASDNSENTALFNEIDWEENIEVDSNSLVDEFAPRPTIASPTSDSHEGLDVTKLDVKKVVPVPEAKPQSTMMQEKGNIEYEFTPGCRIHVMDYTTTAWLVGAITEVDWEEEEVLVHYDNNKSDEWVSMNSQRLSRTNPQPAKPSIVNSEVSAVTSATSLITNQLSTLKTSEPKFKKQIIRSFQRRNRRASRKELAQKRHHGTKSQERFMVGEKVLAKWSDHRMQKFPAVIKRVVEHGQYDVLFYDGFEKTIMGDDLYKATEEEVEKYQQSNPSEADLLFPMDIGSKEERRQRKKKTFDDYLFEKDFQRSRKKTEVLSDSSKTNSTSPMGRKPVVPRPSEKVDLEDQKSPKRIKVSKPLPRSELRKRFSRKHRMLSVRGHEKFPSTREIAVKDGESKQIPEKVPLLDVKPVKVNEPSKLFSNSEPILSEETSVTKAENKYEPSVSKKIVPNTIPLENDRWSGDVPRDVYPIKITGFDGVQRKSVIVPDKKLPPRWIKHALLVKAGGSWDCFLISPEGYKLRTIEEVKEYFNEIKQEEPPEGLDMCLNMRTLPELVLKQNDLIAKGTCKRWEKKKEKRSRKSSQAEASMTPLPTVPQVPHQVGRVRTLLPKYRTSSPVNVSQPPSPAASGVGSAPESEVWRCPKQGCDKKFRKENLLQMHIKHYHAEFKALVGTAPNMVDLALARSENVNSDWRQEQNRAGVIKRIVPKTPSFPEKHLENERAVNPPAQTQPPAPAPQPSLSLQAPVIVRNDTSVLSSSEDMQLPKRTPPAPAEEKKTTIKTIFPIRQPVPEPTSKLPHESDDVESEEDVCSELTVTAGIQKLPTNKLLKQSRSKKAKTDTKLLPISSPVDDFGIKDQGSSTIPGSKFIKKKPLGPIEKLQIITDSNDSYTEEEKISPNTEIMDEIVVLDRIRSEEVINCICGYREEDGLMIQCDICLCWQHGLCYGIENESEVPDRYVCIICQNPVRVRSSKKYIYAQQYLTQAKLPSLSFRTSKEVEIRQRENILKRCYDISSSLHQVQNVEHSLRAKINIAQQSDHPKLYLWAKHWDATSNVLPEEKRIDKQVIKEENDTGEKSQSVKTSAPEPEAPIDLEECRLRLLDHVEQCQHQIESRLTTLQAQVAALESQDSDLASEEASDHYPLTKQTVHMLLRDLSTIKKVASIN